MTTEHPSLATGQASRAASERDVLSREQLLERERQRRMALVRERASRASAPTATAATGDSTASSAAAGIGVGETLPAVPAGFGTREVWQEALQTVARIAAAVREAGHPCRELGDGRPSLTADGLARAIVDAVRRLSPGEALKLLVEAHDCKLPVLPDLQALRARYLLEDLKDLDTLDRRPEDADTENAADRAWRLYVHYDRLTAGPVDAGTQRELTQYLPLPVVDDLVDAGCLTARAVPEEGSRRLYLQARLTPSEVSTDGLLELGWHSEVARRDFYRRLAEGDASALDETSGLTNGQSVLVAKLRAVVRSGRIEPELSEERWLWPLLERLAPQASVDLRRDKSFGPWLVVRRIQRALRLAHQSRLRGDEQKRLTMLRTAWNDAQALQRSWTLAGWEARNVMAYLLVLHSDDGPRYEEALDILSPAPGSGMREDGLPWEGRRRLEGNREVLHQLARQRDRNHILNPYLVLGVPDGADDWKDQWRALRRRLDVDGEALANEAKDAIEAFERGQAAVAPYAVFLVPDKWSQPQAGVPEVTRRTMPMPRQTPPSTEDERQFAKQRAAAAILETAPSRMSPPSASEFSEDLLRKSSSE